jgi:hypothetical protein
MHNWKHAVAALLAASLAVSCTSGPSKADRPITSFKTSHLVGYASLDEQVIDADLVVLGSAVDAASGGSTRFGDGSGASYGTMVLTVRVDEILRTSGAVEAAPGSEIHVSTFAPDGITIDEARQLLLADGGGIWLLMDSNSLRRRMGLEPRESSSLIFQGAGALVLRSAAEEVRQLLPIRTTTGSFGAFVQEIRTAATKAADTPQPERPLGLPEGWGEPETRRG